MSQLIYPTHLKAGQTSDLCVMKSAAGFYVGTYFMEDFGLVPNSRDSGYFATFEEADGYLKFLTCDEDEAAEAA